MASVEWDPKAREFLRKLPKEIAQRIFRKVDFEVALNPERYLEALVGIGAYKVRVGEYRLFVDYYKDRNHLMVRAIRHRRDAYKKRG